VSEQWQVSLLTMEQLEAAHQIVAEVFEDDAEPMPAWREGDRAKLEKLCHCTEVTAFGQEKYPELHVKASKLFYSGIKLHAFPNGNKRFGLVVTLYFLLVNGFELDAEADPPSTIAKLVARSDPRTGAGKPDTVIELIADAYFKHVIVRRDDKPAGTGGAELDAVEG
jgi:prophage maintenance system killer protein